ncbi:MAG: hypothetical protein ABIO43_04830 [Sphingomicrobium sp.]
MMGPAVRSVLGEGAAYSIFNLLGISAIVWLALVAGLAMLVNDDGEPATRSDYAIALPAALMIIIPVANAASVGLTLLAIYAIATGGRNSDLRRAGIVFLSTSGSLIWGRLILALFTRSLLHIDAFFITNLTGAEQIGNRILFIDQSKGGFVVAPGCSSLQGISLAFVFWATVTQWYRVPFTLKSALWCAAAITVTLAINIVRMGLLARFPEHFVAIHTGWGWYLASWSTLAAVVSVIVYGARHEIFDKG